MMRHNFQALRLTSSGTVTSAHGQSSGSSTLEFTMGCSQSDSGRRSLVGREWSWQFITPLSHVPSRSRSVRESKELFLRERMNRDNLYRIVNELRDSECLSLPFTCVWCSAAVFTRQSFIHLAFRSVNESFFLGNLSLSKSSFPKVYLHSFVLTFISLTVNY